MHYFCYISRTKVDQLFQSYFPREVDEWTEQATTEHDIGGNVETYWSISKILSLFKAGITYGRKGVMQRERKIKLQYTEKLRRVLLAIARERPISYLSRAISLSSFDSLYYHHDGLFRIDEPIARDNPDRENANKIVTVRTKVASKSLLLDCSLRFFSEANEVGKEFSLINSSNSRFFAGEVELPFETVFVYLGTKGNKIIGTPLFLKLLLERAEIPQIL